MEYDFVISEDCEDFTAMCNERLASGWEISGSINIAHYNSPPKRGRKPYVGTTYAQAFVRGGK